MDHLQERLEALEQRTHIVERQLRWWRGLAGGLLVLGLLSLLLSSAQVQGAAGGLPALEERVAALEDLLKHFTREGNEVRITGANLHIRNGLGRTDCDPEPDCPNGLGNLIVGYNELRPEGFENFRTGSHNVVVGYEHNFSRFGGIIVGRTSTISGDFASVSGGGFNTASADFAVVSGGVDNVASGFAAAVSGGGSNTAGRESSAVSGGFGNTASGGATSISGGLRNTASGGHSSVSGGENNTASGDVASVSGGLQNTASGILAVVSGGREITQETDFGWAAGSFGGEVSGSFRSP